MNINIIKKIIKLVDKTEIYEIKIKKKQNVIHIIKYQRNDNNIYESQHKSGLNDKILELNKNPSIIQEKEIKSYNNNTGHILKSPMVGTVYIAPSPKEPPYVQVGQKIKIGDVLCIIEAMKMFNEIESDCEGIISEILINDGDPIEYNQPLFVIK